MIHNIYDIKRFERLDLQMGQIRLVLAHLEPELELFEFWEIMVL